MLIKQKTAFSYWLICTFLIFSIGLFFSILKNSLEPLMISFTVFYIITILYSIYYTGLISLYSIYLYTSAFFIYNCIPLSLIFTDKNFLVQTFGVQYKLSEDVGFKFLITCFIAVFSTHISYCTYKSKKIIRKQNVIVYKNKKSFQTMIIILFLIFLIPLCYKIYIQLQFVKSNGFTAVYTDAYTKIKYPIWTTGAFLFFNSAYIIFISTKPKKKLFIWISIVYIAVTFFNALKGGRGGIINVLIIFLFMLNKQYRVKFSFKRLLILFSILVTIMIFITNVRESYENDDIKSKSNISLTESIAYLFWSQTTTRAVPLLIIRGNLEYHPYPFILSPFTAPFTKRFYKYDAATIECIKYSNDPSIVLLANVNMYGALIGGGYGSAFIGEAYECYGFFGVLFFCYIFGLIIGYFDVYGITGKRFSIPLKYILLTTIPISPRKEIFQLFTGKFNTILICYAVFLVVDFFVKYMVKNQKDKI